MRACVRTYLLAYAWSIAHVCKHEWQCGCINDKEHCSCPLPRSHNVTQAEHSRMKRSLKSTASRVWKGFKFRLESPSVNWVKHVGGSKLGASMGVICRNLLDIQLSEYRLKSCTKRAFNLLTGNMETTSNTV